MVAQAEKFSSVIDTPFGQLGIYCNNDALIGVSYLSRRRVPYFSRDPLVQEIRRQIEAYTKNPAHCFDLPIALEGSEFGQEVWQVLRRIPAGQTMTYGEIAAELNTAPRAVGGACKRNPVALIVPCHRAVGRQHIGGFFGHTSGRAIETKSWLLAHEASLNTPAACA